MNLRRCFARSISELVACTGLLRAPAAGLRILMYHAIGTPALGDRLGLFSLSPAFFRAHMECLAAEHACGVVEFSPHAPAEPRSRVAITFDDGYMDNLEVAAPILCELGLPFTIFVTSDFVRQPTAGFLTPDALRELAALPGCQIGAHGATHVALSECDDNKLRNELLSSRRYLEDVIGRQVTTMAYPYGAANRRVRDAAKEAGYRLAACSHAGINRPERDPLLLTRTEITSHDTPRVFHQKLRGDWDWYRWRTQDPRCH